MNVSAIHHVPMLPEYASPFSAAYSVQLPTGKLLFCSGCGPVPTYHKHPHDPVEEAQWLAGDFREQCERTFENIRLTLHAAGGEWRHVVKLNIHLTDMANQNILNEISARIFGADHPPARTLLGAPLLAHPKMLLEVEAIAAIPN
ncbi:MAG: RidA family protein [Lautropia sp.]